MVCSDFAQIYEGNRSGSKSASPAGSPSLFSAALLPDLLGLVYCASSGLGGRRRD